MKKNMFKVSLMITGVILCEKILGFVREVVQAYFFGTSDFMDSLISANLIISVFFGWLATISVAYTPVYKRKDLIGEGVEFTNTVKTLCYLLSVLSLGICIFFSKQLVAIALPGFTLEKSLETVQCLIVLAFSILFMSSTKVNNAYIAANGYYVRSIIPSIAINVIQIIALIISLGEKKYIVACGIVTAYFTEWILSVLLAKKTKLRFRPTLKDKAGIKDIINTIIPITITYIIDDICTFFDKLFASFLKGGSISSLAYANSLRKVIYGVVTVLISTVLYPKVAEYIARKQDDKARKSISAVLSILVIIMLPVILTFIVMANEIVTVIFERGAFNTMSTALTTSSFMAYLLGLIPLSCNAIITKYFYANNSAKYCTLLSAITVGTNVILDAAFFRTLEHTGLALATSLAVFITMPAYLFIYVKTGNKEKYNRNSNSKKIVISGIICVIVSVVLFLLKPYYAFWFSFGIFRMMIAIFVCLFAILSAMWIPLALMKENYFRILLVESTNIIHRNGDHSV